MLKTKLISPKKLKRFFIFILKIVFFKKHFFEIFNISRNNIINVKSCQGTMVFHTFQINNF